MKKLRAVIAILLSLLTITSLTACAIKVAPMEPMSSADEADAMGFAKNNVESNVAVGEYVFLSVKIRDEYKNYVNWESSNPEIATVDASGRVDGLKEGSVTITATAMSAKLEFPITVKKGKTVSLSTSTAKEGTAAAMSALSANKRTESDDNLYALLIILSKNTIVVYTYDTSGIYNIPVRRMVCATEASENLLLKHDYTLGERERWHKDDNGMYYQFSSRFSEDLRILSTPYEKESSSSLVVDEYNKLGTACTDGNIWVSAADAQWIYDNCNDGTIVRAVRDYNITIAEPLPITLAGDAAQKRWDPTDPSEDNPYKKATPYFEGVEDVSISIGTSFSPMNGITAYDTCSNSITKGIKADGNVNVSKKGTYIVSYYCTDKLNRTGRHDRRITVK